MSSTTFRVFNRNFRTKAAAREWWQRIWHDESRKPWTRIGGEEEDVLVALLRLHPDAGRLMTQRGGMVGIVLGISDWNKRNFQVLYRDETTESFAPDRCIGWGVKSRQSTKVKQAIRAAVLPQILAQRTLSGDEEIHHEDQTFAQLLGIFLRGKGMTCEQVGVIEASGGSTTLADAALATEWQAWHERNARLKAMAKGVHLVVHHGFREDDEPAADWLDTALTGDGK